MTSYPVNSPEAAARVLAMALVSDGQYSMVELRALDRQNAAALLGLTPEAVKGVIDGFCQDLLQASGGLWTGRVDATVRQQLMNEITDRNLQNLVLQLCEGLMLADGHLADGEIELMDALSAAWRRPVLL
jgi:hypothetical protein